MPSLRNTAHDGVLCTFSTRISATPAGFARSSQLSSSRPESKFLRVLRVFLLAIFTVNSTKEFYYLQCTLTDHATVLWKSTREEDLSFFLSSTLFAMQEFLKEKFARPTTKQTAL